MEYLPAGLPRADEPAPVSFSCLQPWILRAGLRPWLGLCLSLFGITAAWPAQAAEPKPLRVLVTTASSLPFANISQTQLGAQLSAGIVRDWALAIGEELKVPVRFVLIPARRVTQLMREQGFDIQCFESPGWYGAEDQAWVDWLDIPLMDVIETLISLPEQSPVHELKALEGKTIGVVNGYRYPLLDPLFNAGRLHRSIAPSEASLLQMQLLGRADYSVISRLQFEYARSRDPRLQALRVSPLEASRTPLRCLRHRLSPFTAAALRASLQELIARGRLNEILQQYR